MSELNKRIITALVLVALVWVWYFRLPSPWFETVLVLIGWGATCELILMMKLRGSMIYMVSSLPLWIAFLESPQVTWLLLAAIFWFGLFVMTSREHEASFGSFFAFIWLFSWIYLFALAVASTHGSEMGQGLVIGACLAVWASDIAAYFVGRAIGRRKLCPAISPGKSIEGLAGGVLFAVPVAVVCWLAWGVLPFGLALMLAIITVFSGALGDLSESAVKRLVGVKDSGRWLPGHGGILDRIDAIIMAVPVAWLLWGVMV
ncbi:phosphatidate cytidylyltransferase [Mariprofundus ferrinatatus]|uniref:Phosphatidate cytidylyltransferase n=1 Tax=Mariprofundus ferrinatatus TaxID=1921087 RepID=A0A2K8L8X6_9PROT|nr:phosphatidate cytidylyltransferase [Mariprofundus ferrinatatus]ATX82341.1 phosphatidate cytidylyltransferase [Mariprofundus ferrinatatus]